MGLAQKISSLVLSLRKKVNIRVRQPLNKIMIPVLNASFQANVDAVKELILSEVNIKEIEYITDTTGVLVKKIKANFKELGKKVGGLMKAVNTAIGSFTQEDISRIEKDGFYALVVEGQNIELTLADVEILSEDIPGWLVASLGPLTVALDVNISKELLEEGIAREIVNRIQNIRKDKGYDVTDKIVLEIQKNDAINAAIANNLSYICAEILATHLQLSDNVEGSDTVALEVDENIKTFIKINRN